MHILFFFLDGIGLGANNSEINPFARAAMPVLQDLLGGKPMTIEAAPFHDGRVTLLPLDTTLGVGGMPQSATGQAVLLTGKNIPAQLGYHFGPWPNHAILKILEEGNIFSDLSIIGKRVSFLNAYPPRYFHGIESGKRIYSSIPQAYVSAGFSLKTAQDLYRGDALSADFTAKGWVDRLGLPDTPVLTPFQAGKMMAILTQKNDFSLFEYWLSDYAGHEQDMQQAVYILEVLDQVLAGLLVDWDFQNGLILITSDHGNMEDLSTRRHTINHVPALVIGHPRLRREFVTWLRDLTHIAPAIRESLNK